MEGLQWFENAIAQQQKMAAQVILADANVCRPLALHLEAAFQIPCLCYRESGSKCSLVSCPAAATPKTPCPEQEALANCNPLRSLQTTTGAHWHLHSRNGESRPVAKRNAGYSELDVSASEVQYGKPFSCQPAAEKPKGENSPSVRACCLPFRMRVFLCAHTSQWVSMRLDGRRAFAGLLRMRAKEGRLPHHYLKRIYTHLRLIGFEDAPGRPRRSSLAVSAAISSVLSCRNRRRHSTGTFAWPVTELAVSSNRDSTLASPSVEVAYELLIGVLAATSLCGRGPRLKPTTAALSSIIDSGTSNEKRDLRRKSRF